MNEQLIDQLMDFELGKLNNAQMVDLMKEIKKEGCLLSLQPHYTVLWNTLIDLGVLGTGDPVVPVSDLSS